MRKWFVCVVILLLVLGKTVSLNPSLNDDLLGLIVFKADIQDPDGTLTSWNEDDYSPCNWKGVRCDPRSNRVSDLTLDGFGLSGRIGRGILQLQFLRKLSLAKNNLTGGLSFSLAQLENLRVIDLSENSLMGPVPSNFFGQCGSLISISLANNKFTGPVPDSLSSCSVLGTVNFSRNQFSGLLPSGIWSLQGLRSLDLSRNLIEGEIPKGFEGVNNLREIRLAKNQLTGEIPDGIGNCLLLRSIDLSENSFSGSLPSSLQMLSLCKNLNLHKNSFTGEVPEWIGEMSNLETLDLSDNSFSGPLPTSVGKFRSIKLLNLSMNSFSGSLPESIIYCVNLVVVDVSRNSLTGNLPTWLFKLGLQNVNFSENKLTGDIGASLKSLTDNCRQNLAVLDMSKNSLTGAIPLALGDINKLQYLNLSKNSLVGGIPDSIEELKALDILDMSQNQLNGSIPTKIGEAVSLRDLRLENNFLSGKIPTSIEKCTSLTSLVLSRNSLTGSIPAAFAKLINLQTIDLSFNQLTGTLPRQMANLDHLLSFNISHNQVQDSIPANPSHRKKLLSISALIAIGAAATIIIGVIAITVLNLRVHSATPHSASAFTLAGGDGFSSSPTTDANSGKLVMFSGDPDFSTEAHALLNKDCELGRGGFGAVYRTVLKDGRSVAIKKLTVSSLVKSQEEFEREVKKLGKIHHRNLVAIEGYYWTPSLQLLIYEFVSGGNLYKHLHEGSGGNFLSWNARFTIILGIAKSLAHLHQMNIIHYNLKSSNILIDSLGEPKVADSGLARLLPMIDRYVLSSKIQSALGYMAPEFGCKTVKITEKCDVYGFGILALEVVTGRRPVEYKEDDVVVLCDMVRGALEEGRVEECVDERLKDKFPPDEAIPVMKLGLICTSHVPSNRPDMAEVINILELIRCPSGGRDELV
uniref:Protein kinase domain-containing protein n=1 Tax=Daucus carota subsp. sativus TaxID=79200 RepID=A0A166A421_DAUCS